MRMTVAALSLLFALPAPVAAQQAPTELGAKLVQDASVKAALAAAKADEARTLAEQVEICEVEAPPFKEAKRAELYARKFRELGLQNVRVDKVGQRARRASRQRAPGRISCSPRTSTRSSRKAPA